MKATIERLQLLPETDQALIAPRIDEYVTIVEKGPKRKNGFRKSWRNGQTKEVRSVGECLDDLRRITGTEENSVLAIASCQISLLDNYHKTILTQARSSYWFAVAAAIVGILILIASVVLVYLGSVDQSVVAAVAGTVIEFIAAVNFFLFGRTSSRLAEYHERIDRTQRFLLANSLCDQLNDEHVRPVRAELIRVIAGRSIELPASIGQSSDVAQDERPSEPTEINVDEIEKS